MKKKLPKIKPCPAGHEAQLQRLESVCARPYYVSCSRSQDASFIEESEPCFWFHEDMHETGSEAILAWNKRA